jgi:mono/diheme cytochrome c family protein
MNDALHKRQPIPGRYCLLLPVVAFLLVACGMPYDGKAARPPIRANAALYLDETSTSGTVRAPTDPIATPNQSLLSASANASNGKQLFNTFQPAAGMACATCHRVDSEERLVGPGLLNVGKRAQTRIPGMSAIEYLHQSIVRPSAYIVEGYSDLMPKNWGQVFSKAQIDDLIAYLLTLKAG